MPGPAEVSLAQLALDYEAFVGRALPASPPIAGYAHAARGAGPNPSHGGRRGRVPPNGMLTAMQGPRGAVSLPPP